jgi:hypothetical protein
MFSSRPFHRWIPGILLAAELWIPFAPPRASAQIVRDALWYTDGGTDAIAQLNNTIYVGGLFTRVGPACGSAAVLDASTGDILPPPYPHPDAPVLAVVPDDQGGCYLGGAFTTVQGQSRSGVAHLDSTGGLTPWAPVVGGSVRSLVVSGGVVYLAGDFDSVNSVPRDRLAAVDEATGALLPWAPVLDAGTSVSSMAVSNGAVYLGGSFGSVNALPRSRLAAVDAVTAGLLPWNPSPNGSAVSVILISGGTIYAGGDFTAINGQVRAAVAAIDAATAGVLPFNAQTTGSVLDLEMAGGVLWMGGSFTTVGGQPRVGVASVDAITGAVTSWDAHSDAGVTGLAVASNGIYVCGTFTSIGGQSRSGIAMLDGSANATGWNSLVEASKAVTTIAAWGSRVYVGGDFKSIGMKLRTNVAAFDATSGVATSWNPNANSRVNALAVAKGMVYIGGTFTTVGGVPHARLAAVDPLTGTPSGFSFDANNEVYQIASSGSTLYVGGEFTTIAGVTRNHLASIDLTTSTLRGWDPNVNGTVYAIFVTTQTTFPFIVSVYIGGAFGTVGGVSRPYLASIDGTTGAVFDWNPVVNNSVRSILVVPVSRSTVIYVGGIFTSIAGQPRQYLASVDPNGNVSPWNPNPDGPVSCLALGPNNTLFAGGSFIYVGALLHPSVACIDRASGALTSWTAAGVGTFSFVYSLFRTGSMLCIAGEFPRFNPDGIFGHFNFVGISDGTVTAVELEPNTAPRMLLRAAPNPFRHEAAVSFTLPRSDFAEVSVFDVSGRSLRRLHTGVLAAGEQRMTWNGRDDAGVSVPSGVYFLRVKTATLELRSKIFRVK